MNGGSTYTKSLLIFNICSVIRELWVQSARYLVFVKNLHVKFKTFAQHFRSTFIIRFQKCPSVFFSDFSCSLNSAVVVIHILRFYCSALSINLFWVKTQIWNYYNRSLLWIVNLASESFSDFMGMCNIKTLEDFFSPERRHGSTRVPRHAFIVWSSSMTDGCAYFLYNISWKFHLLAAGQLLSRQPVRYGKDRRYKITPGGSLSSSQLGGPPWWASPLAFGLIGFDSARKIRTGAREYRLIRSEWWTVMSTIYNSIKQLNS